MEEEDQVVEVAFPVPGLPPPPDEALDPYLDAAARCMARHGVRRTTPADIAKELGVSRMTVYRHVGTIDRVLQLLFTRDLHRLLAALPSLMHGPDGNEAVVHLAGALVDWVRSHPVGHKVLADEPDVVGRLLASPMVGAALELGTDVLAGLLEQAMDSGRLARRDARVLASWLVRLIFSVIVVPPPGSSANYLASVIRPVLEGTSPDGGFGGTR